MVDSGQTLAYHRRSFIPAFNPSVAQRDTALALAAGNLESQADQLFSYSGCITKISFLTLFEPESCFDTTRYFDLSTRKLLRDKRTGFFPGRNKL